MARFLLLSVCMQVNISDLESLALNNVGRPSTYTIPVVVLSDETQNLEIQVTQQLEKERTILKEQTAKRFADFEQKKKTPERERGNH